MTWVDDQEKVSEAKDQDEIRIVCSKDQEQDQPTRGLWGNLTSTSLPTSGDGDQPMSSYTPRMEGGTDRDIPPDTHIMGGSRVRMLTSFSGSVSRAGESNSDDNIEGGPIVRSQSGDDNGNGSGVSQYVCGERGGGDSGTEGDKSHEIQSNTRNNGSSITTVI